MANDANHQPTKRMKSKRMEKLTRAEIEGVKLSGTLREKYHLLWSLAFGFFFGILGNFLADHWIEMLRALIIEEWWGIVNAIGFFVVLSVMSVFSIWMLRRLREIQGHYRFVATLLKLVKDQQRKGDVLAQV